METSIPHAASHIKTEPSAELTIGSQRRLVALDVARGLTMFLMIIFNSPGSWEHLYPPLAHAEWHGFTLADLGFPAFIFLVGMSIALAFNKRMQANEPTPKIVWHTAKRAVILFVLGIVLNLFAYDFTAVRIPGVLQRIAIVYFACAMLFLYTDWKIQLRIGIGILITYWLLLLLVPVPGVGRGVLEPGRNLAAWLDNLLIPGTLYFDTWDPEGFLTTFPAIVSGIFGILAGHIVLSNQSLEKKVINFYAYGFMLLIIGGVWNWFFPYNKNLWSSSYVVYTSGLIMLTFGFFIWLIDIRGYTKWVQPFIMFGANAIATYALHVVLKMPLTFYYFEWGNTYHSVTTLFMSQVGQAGFSPEFASLAWAICFTLLCALPIWFLHRRNIIIKI